MTSHNSKSNSFFKPTPSQPTRQQIMEMVKMAEQNLEIGLQRKRNRLQTQIATEFHGYQQEIYDKYELLYDEERRTQIENLKKSRIRRELDEQKFAERKQLEQHIQNSQELRWERSRKLLEECTMGRKEQIQQKLLQQSAQDEENTLIAQEARRRLLEELQKETEAKIIDKQKKSWEAREELEEKFSRKIVEKKKIEAEQEIERKSQQKSDEAYQKRQMEIKMSKAREYQKQQEFLKYQIEMRKHDEECRRQLKIQNDKLIAELNSQQIQKEAAEAEMAKKRQHEENVKFVEFLQRIRSDKKDIDAEDIDLRKLSLMNDEMEANAEAKRQEKKKLLNEELMNEYIRKLNEKEAEIQLERQMEVYSLEQSQKENAEYEEMIATRKAQNRAQFEKDLRDQIEFKNMEMTYNIEQDAKIRQKMDDIDKATCTLTKKLLDEGIESILPQHPFYRCLMHKE